MKWIQSSSTTEPKDIDTTSSPTTVYLHRNVVQKEIKDEMTQTTYTMYEYDECTMTKDEYIDLLTKQNKSLQQQITDTQLALCEVYEGKVKA